jgi:hypothetical protein
MGGHTEVDVTQLRSVADRVLEAAGAIAGMHWPALHPDDLQGSAVAGIAAPDLVAARLTDVVANMRGWALAAHMSADAFERSDFRNASRLDRP